MFRSHADFVSFFVHIPSCLWNNRKNQGKGPSHAFQILEGVAVSIHHRKRVGGKPSSDQIEDERPVELYDLDGNVFVLQQGGDDIECVVGLCSGESDGSVCKDCERMALCLWESGPDSR